LLLFTGEPDITKVLFEALDARAEAAMGVRAGEAVTGEDTEVKEGGRLIDGADWRAINGNGYPIEVLAIERVACIIVAGTLSASRRRDDDLEDCAD
jgi:hypothetical protein